MPQAKDLTTPNCPVERIGHEATALVRAHRDLDAECARLKPEAAREIEQQLNWLEARQRALEAEAGTLRATSLAGAMFQVMLARSAAEELAIFIRPHPDDEYLVRQYRTSIDQLLYSAVAALESLGGLSREDFAGEQYAPRKLDVAARVAARIQSHP